MAAKSNPIAPWQNRHLHKLINLAKIDAEMKAALVQGATSNRATSTKDLTFDEAGQLIKHLEGATTTFGTEKGNQAAQNMRAKLLSMAHEVRWEDPATGKVDMARVNAWCQKTGGGHKELNAYSEAELNKLVSQFRIFRDNFLKPV